jgi:hypothetical protein
MGRLVYLGQILEIADDRRHVSIVTYMEWLRPRWRHDKIAAFQGHEFGLILAVEKTRGDLPHAKPSKGGRKVSQIFVNKDETGNMRGAFNLLSEPLNGC